MSQLAIFRSEALQCRQGGGEAQGEQGEEAGAAGADPGGAGDPQEQRPHGPQLGVQVNGPGENLRRHELTKGRVSD